MPKVTYQLLIFALALNSFFAPSASAAEPDETRAAATTSPAGGSPGADKLRVAGIRQLSGKYLTLYTDLPAGGAADELVDDFDQAFAQWCDYFNVSPTTTAHVTACLMRDKKRFAKAGLLPGDLPDFDHAYFRGNRLWVLDQKDDYYRRHLLLHEGTHAVMNSLLGSCGPPWLMEGLAELLATHSIVDGKVILNQFPQDPEDVPGWGRIELVRDALAHGRRLNIGDILTYDARAHEEVEPYGWCWAACAFLDGHPRYQKRFRELAAHPDAKDFNERFREEFAADWPQLAEEWQLFIDRLEYGYDLAREAIYFRPGKPLAAAGTKVKIAADHGWQSSGVTLEAGKTYHLRAHGRYQVAADPRPWPSGPAGVTIRYWQRKPLGMLLAAVHPEPFNPRSTSLLLAPLPIGEEGTLKPDVTGTLYLRINDSPAELDDNKGTVEVQVSSGAPENK